MSKSELMEKIRVNTISKYANVLNKSVFFKPAKPIDTGIPMMNVALSGKINGGLHPGLTTIAGPSRYFKSSFGLIIAKAFQDKYKDGIVLFYDTEFGTPPAYISNFGLDTSRIFHNPVTDVEQLKFEVVNQLEKLDRKDNIFIFIDSIGNAASKKEVDDALDQSSKADMTRAKAIKSLMRIITPHLRIKEIPCVVINHTYKSQDKYPRDIMSGGTGPMLSSNTVWIIGRSQEKDSTKELIGYNFTIKIEKSRFIKESSKIPIRVVWDTGINKYSGFSDLAVQFKLIKNIRISRSAGYQYTNKKGKVYEVLAKDIDLSEEFWNVILKETDFQKQIEQKYSIENKEVIS